MTWDKGRTAPRFSEQSVSLNIKKTEIRTLICGLHSEVEVVNSSHTSLQWEEGSEDYEMVLGIEDLWEAKFSRCGCKLGLLGIWRRSSYQCGKFGSLWFNDPDYRLLLLEADFRQHWHLYVNILYCLKLAVVFAGRERLRAEASSCQMAWQEQPAVVAGRRKLVSQCPLLWMM